MTLDCFETQTKTKPPLLAINLSIWDQGTNNHGKQVE